jgi:2-hydroxy-6-oxonona-2,4-dienedioate hydrolase
MPFIASNGLTEAGTSKAIAGGGTTVHYHDLSPDDQTRYSST